MNGFNSQRIKHLASINSDSLGENTDPDFEFKYVDIGNVNSRGEIAEMPLMTFGKAPSRARRKVQRGDVIVSTVRTYLQAIAPIDFDAEDVVVSTGFAVVRPQDFKLYPGFAKYAFREPGFLNEVMNRSVGVSYPAINSTDIADIKIPNPSLETQRRIASYLDRETSEIDRLIAAKERLLTLLAEKRRALITHMVTGSNRDGSSPIVGTNSRHDGFRWFGCLPNDWTTARLKNLVSYKSGAGITGESISESGEYPVYGGNGLRGYTSSYTHDGEFVLIGRQGALCGNVHIASGKFWASEHAVVLTPANGVHIPWLAALLDSMNLNQYSMTAAQPGLSMEFVGQLPVPLPPGIIQRKIAEHLNHETRKIEILKESCSKSIELLQERRSALIAAAVTGELEV